MVRKSSEAVAAMGMAVLLAVAVAGNYTLAKDEVKHLNDEKPTTGQVADTAKCWAAWAKELVKQVIPGTKEYKERGGSEKEGEARGMKDAIKDSVPQAFSTFSDKEKDAAHKRVEDTEEKVKHAKEKVTETLDATKHKAADSYETAKGKAGETLDVAKKKASESYETAKGKAGETLSSAKNVARNVYDKTKKKANANDGGRGSHVDEL